MHLHFRSDPIPQRVLTHPYPLETPWVERAAVASAAVPYDSCVSCVVPCLNEAENLRVLLPLLRSRLSALCSRWEIIVADDGSTDATESLMAEWTQHAGFRYVQLSRNFGKEAALSAGLQAAIGDAVICLDADLQHPPRRTLVGGAVRPGPGCADAGRAPWADWAGAVQRRAP